MKTCAIALLLVALALPASAAVIHDESINGDLATNPAAPTALAFSVGGNTVIGTTGNTTGTVDRDYITFTLGPGQMLTGLTLLGLAPDNIAFTSFNAGNVGIIPSGATIGDFLAGIHINAANIGANLMVLFDTASVTTNSLPTPDLGPGTYTYLIQQTSPIEQSYSLEFIIQEAVPTAPSTWGGIKAMYR
jgi:hypothetical protein